jgi:hypothetical protein
VPAKTIPAYLVFDDTSLHFDAVLNELCEHTSTVTESAVEEGANVADHVRAENPHITLELFISNSPVRDVNELYNGQVAGLELKVPEPEKSIPFTPGAAMTALGDAIGNALNPPTPWKAEVLQFPERFNNVQYVESTLIEWKDNGEMGEVITPHRLYENMVITRVSKTRTKETGDGANITVELKGVRLVEVKSITAPVPTETRGKVKKPKGKQPTTAVKNPAQKKSILTKILKG